MQWNLKKKLPLIATSLVALTGIISADENSAQIRNLENRVTALEQRKGASGMINPQGRPQVNDGWDLILFGDLLYWNAHENGMQVAVVEQGDKRKLSDSDVDTIHGKWNVGFRVGIGYNMPHDGWDTRLTWLRFTDNGHKNAHTGQNHVVYPTQLHPADPLLGSGDKSVYARKMHSRWHMRLDQLDWDLGREFFVSKWLTLRPHFGLRTDWIRQGLDIDYKEFHSSHNKAKVDLSDHWWGIGLEGGLDTQWGLGSGWSIFGNLTSAIIYGIHKISYEVKDKPKNHDFVDIKNHYRIAHPVLDLVMGLRWDNMFSHDRYHLGFEVGWENHIYFSQNQFPIFVSRSSKGTFVSNQGDLTFQGWTFGARLDF